MRVTNVDFKSIEQLQSAGGQGKDLTNDTKILCMASDDKRLLSDAIEAGDISDDVSLGFNVKNRSVWNSDVQLQNQNIADYELQLTGIELLLPYFIGEESFVRLTVDGYQVFEKIEDLTQEAYYEFIAENKIRVYCDLPFYNVEVLVLNGIESTQQIKKFMSVNKTLFSKSFLVSDMTENGTNYEYLLPEAFSSKDLCIVSVNGKLWQDKYQAKKYTITYPNLISFKKTDMALNDKVYVFVISSDALVDANGSVVLSDRVITDYVIEGLTSNVRLSVLDSGEVVADTTTDPHDLIFLRSQSGNTYRVTVSNSGELETELMVGGVSSEIILKSLAGNLFILNVDSEGNPCTQPYKKISGRLAIGSDLIGENNISFKMLKAFDTEFDHALDDSIRVYAKDVEGVTHLMKHQGGVSTLDQVFSNLAIGTIVDSQLSAAEFLALNGPSWKILNGSVSLDKNIYTELASILPAWIVGDNIVLPAIVEKQLTTQYKAGDNGNVPDSHYPPTGFKLEAAIQGLQWTGADISAGNYPAGVNTVNTLEGYVTHERARNDETMNNFAIYSKDIKISKYIKAI